jgi:hypothetical protein
MHYIQSKCHLLTTLHESGPKDLRSHSRVKVKSYKIMHRPLKRNHASLLAKRIRCLTLYHALRKLSVRKIHSCFTIYFTEFVNHSFLIRLYMQQLCWSSYLSCRQAPLLCKTNQQLSQRYLQWSTSFNSPSSRIFLRILLLHKMEPAVRNLFTLFSNCFRVWK